MILFFRVFRWGWKFIFFFKARRILNIVREYLIFYNVPSTLTKEQEGIYLQKIRAYRDKLKIGMDEIELMCLDIKSFEDFFKKYENIIEIDQMGYRDYIKFDIFLKLNEEDQNRYLQLAIDFKNYKLNENGQGDINRLARYVRIPFEHILRVKDVMVSTKIAGCPLTQKEILTYYNSNRPFTENLDLLRDAWINYNEKFKNFPEVKLSVDDLMKVARKNRDIVKFVNNFYKIKSFSLDFSLDKLEVINLSDEEISSLITTLIKLKLAKIEIKFSDFYSDLGKLDVNQVLISLIKFKQAGFEFDYSELKIYFLYSKNIEKLIQALIYNKNNKLYHDYKTFYKKVIEIISNIPQTVYFDPLLYLAALEKALKNRIVEAEEYELFEKTEEQIKQDYLAGHDVFANLLMMELLAKHNIKISYTLSKFIEKSFGDEEDRIQRFKNTILSAIQPILIEGESFLVTTKDNIEIKAQIVIEVLLNINNYFTGSDEKVLLNRANTIFIDEIQKKYNHDEIILNIDTIAKNILYRLLEETPSQFYEYTKPEKMKKIDENKDEFEFFHSTEKHQNKEHNDEHKDNGINSDTFDVKKFTKEKENKLITTSKYIPRRVLIPKIEFVKETFKEYEKEKHMFEMHKLKMMAELERIRTELELKKAWAESKDGLKYLILKDDDNQKNDISH